MLHYDDERLEKYVFEYICCDSGGLEVFENNGKIVTVLQPRAKREYKFEIKTKYEEIFSKNKYDVIVRILNYLENDSTGF